MPPARLKSAAKMPRVCYTRNNGNVYATLLDWNGGPVTLKALRSRRRDAGQSVQSRDARLRRGADVCARRSRVDRDARRNRRSRCRESPISRWRPRAASCASRTTRAGSTTTIPARWLPGWIRRCQSGHRRFQQRPHHQRNARRCLEFFVHRQQRHRHCPKEAGAGKIEIQIDGQTRATADLSTTGARQAQQTVCEVTGLPPGKHTITIINRGPGPVAVDALIVR